MICERISIFVAALCCILKTFAPVEGRFFLEVNIYGYSNPTGRCRGCLYDGRRGCCDQFTRTTCTGDLLCDSFFTYCLGSNEQGCISNSIAHQRTSAVNENDGPIDFSQSTVLNLENPLILQGLTNAYHEVELLITVTDQDTNNPDELVDILEISHTLPVGQISPRRNHTGVYNFDYVIMDLSTRVLCAPNFRGSECTECASGFTGEVCDVNIDDCAGIDCSGRGVCEDGIDTFNCRCDPGFTGIHCEINIDECAAVNCSGQGQCTDLVNSFRCICATGFTGLLCEMNIDDCQATSCSGRGQCIDGINSFTCNCERGFTGRRCEVNIDECIGVSCSGNGDCVDGVASFTCLCDPGYTGESCEIDINDCVGVNCSGNGECVDGINSFTCECNPGHSGQLCTEELRGDNSTGPIVGGVLGVILSLLLILILVVAVVLIMRCRNGQTKGLLNGRKTGDGALPGDNPVYDGGDAAITLGALPWTDVPIHYENLSCNTVRPTDFTPAPDREIDNPIYGRNELENSTSSYTNNFPQTGIGMEAVPYHDLDNPIYGQEIDDNTYSVISDSSIVNATSFDAGKRAVYENIKEEELTGSGSERIYDHIN